mmetsp:Transcript_4900/g.14116  ORF Transcript_4900/g.14116 Transcript_4900/m.14116 type:complete len:88 (+) Transcript_4900:52-315(+)
MDAAKLRGGHRARHTAPQQLHMHTSAAVHMLRAATTPGRLGLENCVRRCEDRVDTVATAATNSVMLQQKGPQTSQFSSVHHHKKIEN